MFNDPIFIGLVEKLKVTDTPCSTAARREELSNKIISKRPVCLLNFRVKKCLVTKDIQETFTGIYIY